MKNLILKNSEWYRGKRTGSALLRGKDRRRCCLGIAARAYGVADKHILGVGYPSDIECRGLDYTKTWADVEARVGDINDNVDFLDEERIELLRPYFEARGINLIFDPES